MKVRISFQTFLILITIFNVTGLFAQDRKVVLSEKFPRKPDYFWENIIYEDLNNIYIQTETYKGKAGSPGILKYNKQLKTYEESLFTLEEKQELLKIAYVGGDFVMLTWIKSVVLDPTFIYSTPIDFHTLKATGKATIISDAPPLKYRKTNWIYRHSPDSACLAVITTYRPGSNRYFSYYVIGKGIDSKEIHIAKPEDAVSINPEDFYLDKKGRLFYLYRNYSDTKDYGAKEKWQGKYAMRMVLLSPDGTGNTFKLPDYSALIKKIQFMHNYVSDELLIMGTLTCKDVEFIDGYCITKFNTETNTVTSALEHKFELSFMQNVNKTQEWTYKEKDQGIDAEHFWHSYIPLSDGSHFCTLEKTWTNGESIHLLCDGIIAFLIDKNGVQKWIKFIPKRQTKEYNINGLSHTNIIKNDQICLMYSERKENLNYKDDSGEMPTQVNYSGDFLMSYSFDKTGRYERKKLEGSDIFSENFLTDRRLTRPDNITMILGNKSQYFIGYIE